MTLKASDFVTAQKETLFNVFDAAWDGMGETYSKICKVEESSDAYEDDLQIQSPDVVEESVEGGMYNRLEVENIRSKRYTHSIFKAELKITKEAIEDLKYKQIVDAVKHLGRAAKRTVEKSVAAAMHNGFTSETSADGSAAFSSHTLDNPLPGRPTTFSNLGTARLTPTALKARRTNGYKTLDEHGSISPRDLRLLVVPSALAFDAEQIVNFPNEDEPGSANHGKNVGARGMKLVVSHWLSEAASNADTQWYLFDPDEHQFRFFWRVKPQQELVAEEATGDALYRIRFRFSRGFSDYRGADGNTGAA
jgi:hypothetical protein